MPFKRMFFLLMLPAYNILLHRQYRDNYMYTWHEITWKMVRTLLVRDRRGTRYSEFFKTHQFSPILKRLGELNSSGV